MILIFEQVDPKLFSNIGKSNIDAINTSVTGCLSRPWHSREVVTGDPVVDLLRQLPLMLVICKLKPKPKRVDIPFYSFGGGAHAQLDVPPTGR